MENPQSAGALQQEEDIVAEPSMKTVVVKPHRATDGTQLDLNVNDIVYVLEQDETGWWGGHKEGEDITGWFPGSCVRILPDQPPLERAQEQQANQGPGVAARGMLTGAAFNDGPDGSPGGGMGMERDMGGPMRTTGRSTGNNFHSDHDHHSEEGSTRPVELYEAQEIGRASCRERV